MVYTNSKGSVIPSATIPQSGNRLWSRKAGEGSAPAGFGRSRFLVCGFEMTRSLIIWNTPTWNHLAPVSVVGYFES